MKLGLWIVGIVVGLSAAISVGTVQYSAEQVKEAVRPIEGLQNRLRVVEQTSAINAERFRLISLSLDKIEKSQHDLSEQLKGK